MDIRVALLTTIAMLAFAANSLLCRMALVSTGISPAAFTAIRLVSGAAFLFLLVALTRQRRDVQGSWIGAICLFIYATGFSFAYVSMNTGTGALLLFGAVQITMLLQAIRKGETFSVLQWLGFFMAVAGLFILFLPGATVPPVIPALLMVSAGIAWGVYSLIGKSANRPLLMTAGNFVRCVPLIALLIPFGMSETLPVGGIVLAILSGAVASGAGYAIWYTALPSLSASLAATVQLSVPVIAMIMGWLVLDELLTVQMLLAATVTLSGIGLVIYFRSNAN
ncbi:DMT family transporter [Salinimonas sp. HHU 13199]|uniref:DMT family transporter n=1 Tax=Salinimonas profundi TaxID=2729140 RepID=A0ABR8LGR3_9ALTE|nr:DMT family transporter [Salinimonas profundi]